MRLVRAKITSDSRVDKKGNFYWFAEDLEGTEYFIPINNIVSSFDKEKIERGVVIDFYAVRNFDKSGMSAIQIKIVEGKSGMGSSKF